MVFKLKWASESPPLRNPEYNEAWGIWTKVVNGLSKETVQEQTVEGLAPFPEGLRKINPT